MKNNKGFTLIELLVVVLIIGILAAIALPQYMKAVAKSRVSDAFATMKAISGAEQRYFLAKGEYTDNFADLDIEFSGAGTTSSYANTATGFTYTLNKTGDGLVTATGNTSLGGTTLTQNFTTNAISFTSDPKGICASFSGVTCPAAE